MKVTIPMACFNSSQFIRKAISSVYKQTYKNWELIIVDDKSTDNSYQVAMGIIKEFKIENKVRILQNKKNKGYGFTLRKAISEGNGEIIAIVDSDDAICGNDSLEKIVKAHKENPGIVMVYTNHWECNRGLKKEKQFTTRQMKKNESMLNGDVKIRHWKTFKRKFYNMTEGVSPELRQTVDKDLVFKLEEVGPFLHIPESLYFYRKHNANLTRSTRKKPKEYRKWVLEMRNKIYTDAKKRRGLI